jgi:superfamily II DNA or RNA helicase
MIGVYVAHHKWLDTEFGQNMLFKVGHSANIGRRLNDSSYITCFVGSWTYKYLYEVNNKEEAEILEAATLSKLNRIEGKELVNNTIEEIIHVITSCAITLNIVAMPAASAISIEQYTLRPYQNEAVVAVQSELALNGRAILNMACRTGKTLIAYNIIKDLSKKWSVYFVPSLILVRQINEKLAKYCSANVIMVGSADGMTTDSKLISSYMKTNKTGIVICTYHSEDIISSNTFDVCIFDEAHRMHKYITAIKTRHYFFNHIYMTATLTSKVMDYANIAYNYSLDRAIREGYVNDYDIIHVDGDLIDQINIASRQIKKMLVFCKSIEQIKVLHSAVPYCSVMIHSKISHIETLIDKFILSPEKTLLFSCRQVQEGIEIPHLDSVFFTYNKTSEIDIVQGICRPLTKLEGKTTRAKIFIYTQ